MRGISIALLLAVVGCDDRGLPGTGDASANSDSGAAYLEQVIRACVVAMGCSPLSAPDHVLQHSDLCIDDFATYPWPDVFSPSRKPDSEVASRVLACAAKHGGDDCAGFHACYGGTWTTLEICRRQATCQGTRIVHTSDPALYFDCASLGASCVVPVPADPWACCARKTCVDGCHSKTKGTRCHDDGVSVAFDCGLVGMICTDDIYRCTGDGEVCSGSVCLSPTVLRHCPGYRQATYDCGMNPFFGVCAKDQIKGMPPCDPAGQECGLQNEPCRGDKLVLCINGYKREVDCTDLGFKGCHNIDTGARCSQ